MKNYMLSVAILLIGQLAFSQEIPFDFVESSDAFIEYDGSMPSNQIVDVVYDVLVWSDEFDTNGLNPVNSTKWFHQTLLPNGSSWYNGEVQHYTNRVENSYVENGILNIIAIKEDFTNQGVIKEYTSARLNSKFAFTYGRVDVRAKLTIEDGTWPAIWLLGKNINENGGYWDANFGTTNWPGCGEIDIMERGIFPGQPADFVQSAIHTPSSFGNTVNKGGILLSDVENTYHIYSMNWSPNEISFLVDDVIFYTYNPSVKNASTWPFDQEQYLLLNVAMGGFAGPIDPTFTQSGMEIDYVRVYQSEALSIDEPIWNDLKIFPNPSNSMININSNVSIDRLELYNVLGALILNKSDNTNYLDVSNVSKGMYLLKVYSEDKTLIKRVLVN